MNKIKSWILFSACLLSNLSLSAAEAYTSMDTATGNAVSVWTEFAISDYTVQGATSTILGGWSAISTALSNGVTNPQNPKAAIAGANIVIVYKGYVLPTYNPTLYAMTYYGLTWYGPEMLSDPILEQVQDDYQIHLANSGTYAIITWTSFVPSSYSFEARAINYTFPLLGGIDWPAPITLP